MCADRSKHPIVHFVGSIPLPDAETVFRTSSSAARPASRPPARRRDRHPQELDPLSAGRARREPGDRSRHRRAAVQVRAMGRQGGARDSAAAPQARRQARSGAFKTGYADMAIAVVGRVRPPAEGRRRSRPTSSSRSASRRRSRRPTTTWCRRDRPASAAGADAAFHRRGREDRRGAAQRPHRGAMGRVPGSARLGGLLRPGPGRFPHRDDRRADGDRRRACRRRSSSAIICAMAARPTSTWCSPRMPASWSR